MTTKTQLILPCLHLAGLEPAFPSNQLPQLTAAGWLRSALIPSPGDPLGLLSTVPSRGTGSVLRAACCHSSGCSAVLHISSSVTLGHEGCSPGLLIATWSCWHHCRTGVLLCVLRSEGFWFCFYSFFFFVGDGGGENGGEKGYREECWMKILANCLWAGFWFMAVNLITRGLQNLLARGMQLGFIWFGNGRQAMFCPKRKVSQIIASSCRGWCKSYLSIGAGQAVCLRGVFKAATGTSDTNIPNK